MDPDLPTQLEAKLFHTAGGKLIWLFLYPLLYSFRPMVVRPLLPTPMELNNFVIQMFFNAVVVHVYGELHNTWKITL